MDFKIFIMIFLSVGVLIAYTVAMLYFEKPLTVLMIGLILVVIVLILSNNIDLSKKGTLVSTKEYPILTSDGEVVFGSTKTGGLRVTYIDYENDTTHITPVGMPKEGDNVVKEKKYKYGVFTQTDIEVYLKK